METSAVQQAVLKILHDNCSPDWILEVINSQVIVQLPHEVDDHRAAYSKAKKEIIACIETHLKKRSIPVWINVKSGPLNCGFKLGANS